MHNFLNIKSRILLVSLTLFVFSFIKIPSALALSNACNVSIDKSRIDVSSWSTEAFTITTSPNRFWLESFPITCTTTINGSWFDTATFNSTYDFGKSKSSNMVENLFAYGNSMREGSNEIKSCSTSISDICSRTYVTGYKKLLNTPGNPQTLVVPVPGQGNSNSGNPAQICTQATEESKVCSPNLDMKWNYETCWSTSSNKVILEKWDKSKKKFIKVKNLSIKKSSECEKKYPKLLKFSHTEKDSKNKTYRLKFVGDKSGWEEKVKVTFE